MKRWLAALLCAAASPAWGVDWRADLPVPQPGKFPAPRAQHATYRFGWGAITAADADLDLTWVGKDQLEIRFGARTVGTVRTLWQMNAEHLALCTVPALRPLWLRQTEIYKKKTEKIRVEFSPAEVMRYREVIPPENPPPKPRRFELPNLLDLQTALLYVRSQRLQVGDAYRFAVYPAKAAYLAKVTVAGREQVRLKGETRNAIKLQLALQQISKEMELEPHEKFKNAYVWLSDDRDRLLLKIEAQVFIGRVWAELQSIRFDGE